MSRFENREMEEYFDGLPAFVKESIVLCDLTPRTLEELRALAENMSAEE